LRFLRINARIDLLKAPPVVRPLSVWWYARLG